MIPGTLRLVIPVGSRFAEQLRLMQGESRVPVDLTGRGPFTCHVRPEPGGELLLALDVEETDLDDGRVTLVAEMEDTADLEPGRHYTDLIDAEGVLLAEGVAIFKQTISQLD